MSRIYIASSWKNADILPPFAVTLEIWGNEVDCFCREDTGRFVFSFRDIDNAENIDQFDMMKTPQCRKAFAEDKKWLDWADTVIMVLPCGRSAHLEAGYAVGQGKRLVILGEFPKGEWDVMYGFADLLVGLNDRNWSTKLRQFLKIRN